MSLLLQLVYHCWLESSNDSKTNDLAVLFWRESSASKTFQNYPKEAKKDKLQIFQRMYANFAKV